MGSLGLWLLCTLWPQVTALSPSLPPAEEYEVVWPKRLPGPRTRRALPSHRGLYPESVSYVLGAGGHTFTLHLRMNRDLLGKGYTETYSAANGSEVTEQWQGQDHCLYQGHVEGHQSSAASLSTCAGLRGFFRVGSAIHLIEPLDGSGEEGQHAVYQARHMQQKAGTCGVSDASLDNLLGPRVSAAFRPQPWNRPLSRDTRYVELYVVTDSKESQQLGSREAVRRRVLEVVNHVDKLYQELNFRVVLVGLEIWSRDKVPISPYANITLEKFLSWRAQDLMGRHPHDNVQLITAGRLHRDHCGTGSGVCPVLPGLWGRESVVVGRTRHQALVLKDHSQNPIGVASTMAHELGHNLGMNHDENIQGCYCPVPREGGGCIMAGSISSKFPRTFSRCSRADLEVFLEKPQTGCLANAPDPDRLVGGPVCGNLFVERGEQCDCGTPQDCQNRCCNATTCQLAAGAECAHGACCHGCRVKPAGEPCRPQRDQCDLEEFCDGRGPACPEDVFQENGTPCPGGYCFNGRCPTLAQRCQELWGPGAQVAADTCFSFSISPGCRGRSTPSMGRADRCGVLYCAGGQKPPERSSCTLSSYSGICQALRMDSEASAYEPVPQGTRCGEGKICWEGRCQDLQVYRSKNCSAQCHNHGVCNHKRECHCHVGWAPPHCAKLLTDPHAAPGSLLVSVLVPLVLLVAMLAALAGVMMHRKVWSHIPRRSVAPKTTMGLSNPLFQEAGSSGPTKGRAPGPPELVPAAHPNPPVRSTVAPKRLPPAPPATCRPPFPVPVHTQQAPEQLRPAPPTKPLPKLKPKQPVKPTSAPPLPPVKPSAGGTTPGMTQGIKGPKVALKPLVRK